jgi:hypothetical protein
VSAAAADPAKPSNINAIPARIIDTPNALNPRYNPNLTTKWSPMSRNALLQRSLAPFR